jgi:hypothetical protein
MKWSELFLWILSLSSPLCAAAQNESLPYPSDALQEFKARMNQDLKKELRDLPPQISALLSSETVKSDDLSIRQALTGLLESEKTASGAHKAAMLLAADLLAEKLWCDQPTSPECLQLRDQMSAHQLTWKYSELGGGWYYQRDLLWRVWNEYGSTRWGEMAFVLLLNHGWDTSGQCQKGAEQFREVIRQGGAFLAAQPASEYRSDVLFEVAEANRTWWSLSYASADDEYVNATKYREGAAPARATAMADYEQVIKMAPGTQIAREAQSQLQNLKSDVKPEQGPFYCVYD